MPQRQDVLGDRRFWASLYAGAFALIGKLEPSTIYSLLDVGEQDTQAWYEQFTGWYPGIFDKSDGQSDDPATVHMDLANSVRLKIEFHPGDQYWFLHGADARQVMLANIGPHWSLPGLRWQEAVAMGTAAPRDGWMAVLLLLPVVWLTAHDNIQEAYRASESAWMASNLVSAESAAALAQLSGKSAEVGRDYQWRRVSDGWLCDAERMEHSQRPTQQGTIT